VAGLCFGALVLSDSCDFSPPTTVTKTAERQDFRAFCPKAKPICPARTVWASCSLALRIVKRFTGGCWRTLGDSGRQLACLQIEGGLVAAPEHRPCV